MKAAFTTWNNRIAPVFDVARTVCIVEADEGKIVAECLEAFKDALPVQKVLCLVQWEVDTLVCGAISRSLQSILTAQSIRVIAFVAGELHEVIGAWLAGRIEDNVFAMPGYAGRRHRNMGGIFPTNTDDWIMDPKAPSRSVGGRGRGGQRGSGRGGGAGGAAGGNCVCPKCGYREPHQRGLPCTQTQCRACGTAMIRA